MLSSFEKLGLLPHFVQAVEQLGFEQPTPIQQVAIPALLEGRDVMGQAQTGSGKTAAFALPMLQKILLRPEGKSVIRALVLVPTRELAIQVAGAAGRLIGGRAAPESAPPRAARVLPVYGGQSYTIQTRQLERGVDVVVGTPGRLLDLIRQGLLDLSQVSYLVLDEADEMLEMGFIEDVEAILAQVPGERQMALFSATLPVEVRKLAGRYLSEPQVFALNTGRRTVAETEQRFCRAREERKIEALVRLLEVEEVKSALIFTRTRARAQELADELVRRGLPADALHGDISQPRREFVLGRFRQGLTALLVATDVAARGLDIEEVSHVFNYDLPDDGEDYVHRIGRTGRAGRKGIAISFVTPRERSRLKRIEGYTHQPLTEIPLPTREQVLTTRDERFAQRISGQIAMGQTERQRALVSRLVEGGLDPLEVAAAAIQLARAGEGQISQENDSPLELGFPVESKLEKDRRFSKGRRFQKESAGNAGDDLSPVADLLTHPDADIQERVVRKTERGLRRVRQVEGPADGAQGFARKKGQHEPGFVRLVMNLGGMHGLRPGDVVGAIASEAGIPGRAIGAIDIRNDFTLVDVSEKHVRDVLRENRGKYFLRGKPVRLKIAN